MKNKKEYYKELHNKMDLNGFKWYAGVKDSKGKYFHYFNKQEEGQYEWLKIKATDEDIENGNLEFMTKHNLTRP